MDRAWKRNFLPGISMSFPKGNAPSFFIVIVNYSHKERNDSSQREKINTLKKFNLLNLAKSQLH